MIEDMIVAFLFLPPAAAPAIRANITINFLFQTENADEKWI